MPVTINNRKMTENELVATYTVELYKVWLKNWFELNKNSSSWPSKGARELAINRAKANAQEIVDTFNKRPDNEAYKEMAPEDGRPF